jgi:hypothetical protein
MSTQTANTVVPGQEKRKKKLVQRAAPDESQRIRHVVQWVFVALNVWVGAQFYLWVRSFERGGLGLQVSRPAGVDGWLPIAGLMNLKYLLATGRAPAVHPAAMFLLIAFLAMSVVLKKAFCGWLCPVGTFSEMLWKAGRRVFGRNYQVPRWLDRELRGLKYLLLGFFIFVIAWMPVAVLRDFMAGPYGMIADVKMLDFFRTIGVVGIAVLLWLVTLSVFIQNFWCRYLCPYGALMGLVSLLSPVKIRRDAEACIDSVGGVHGLHGLCGFLPGRGGATTGAASAEGRDDGRAVAWTGDSAEGGGGDSGFDFLWSSGRGADHGALADLCASRCLYAVGAACG